ncbi:hypothetical protein IV203_029271 [Nitzschia inconspicua]|uniref:Uncharacterized protein n=1 Tax=Nitzschia inconspicua TaxID=303405 RepID=A0A9K3LU03_9STRA|nr:hypothetical protein IV203_029271 [Nitzschia inconspicua]
MRAFSSWFIVQAWTILSVLKVVSSRKTSNDTMGGGMTEEARLLGSSDLNRATFVSKTHWFDDTKMTVDAKARRTISKPSEEPSDTPRILPPTEQDVVQYPFITKIAKATL